jgi:hypothetical protein
VKKRNVRTAKRFFSIRFRERAFIREALDLDPIPADHARITTLLSLAVITLIGVGIRLLTMVTIQQRRERMNRQINERLRALIAAYKTLGGSFTGTLTVDPAHRRDLRQHAEATPAASTAPLDLSVADSPGSDRARWVRDAVEAALSDILLLGTGDLPPGFRGIGTMSTHLPNRMFLVER